MFLFGYVVCCLFSSLLCCSCRVFTRARSQTFTCLCIHRQLAHFSFKFDSVDSCVYCHSQSTTTLRYCYCFLCKQACLFISHTHEIHIKFVFMRINTYAQNVCRRTKYILKLKKKKKIYIHIFIPPGRSSSWGKERERASDKSQRRANSS